MTTNKTKICTKCKEEKDVLEFGNDKSRFDGLYCWCKICRKEYYSKNKYEIIIKNTKYVKENINKTKEYQKQYRLKNKEKLDKQKKEYYIENKELSFARHSLKKIITNWKGSRIKYEYLFGYSLKELKEHLSKFGDIKKLDIDHIIPISYLSKLILNKEELAKWSNRLPNLMLLESFLNGSKHAKLTIEYIPYHHLFDFMCYCLELDDFVSSLN